MISNKVKNLTRQLFSKSLYIELEHIFDYFNNKQDYDIFCDYIQNYMLDDYKRTNDPVEILCEDGTLIKITLFQFLINLYFLEYHFCRNIIKL